MRSSVQHERRYRPWSRVTIPDLAPIAARERTATTAGMLAARAWLSARGLSVAGGMRWHAQILLDVTDQPALWELDQRVDTRFKIEISSDDWGYLFCHGGRASWIRVDDIPLVHGREDFKLLSSTPPLKDLGVLVRALESQYSIRFCRRNALVVTNLPGAEPEIRRWVESL